MTDEERNDENLEGAEPEAPAAEEPEQPTAEETPEPAAEETSEQPAAEEEPPAQIPEEHAAEMEPTGDELIEERVEDAGAPIEQAADDAGRPRGKHSERGERDVKTSKRDDVIPGEHLEPDLVLEEARAEGGGYEFDEETGYPAAEAGAATAGPPEVATEGAPAEGAPPGEGAEAAPAARTPLDLAADARYFATGKRKTSVARVIIKPGSGTYTVNGRTLEEFFPRQTLQQVVRGPLETAGYETRMDVVAKIHGGGVSSQAGALRHGIARSLVEADPNLRGELKRRGFLTRDPRKKERKKAGLKKARKRPQFSKR
jgi:small subunit ribosomal protein S9